MALDRSRDAVSTGSRRWDAPGGAIDSRPHLGGVIDGRDPGGAVPGRAGRRSAIRRDPQRGSAVVEFALVAPLAILIALAVAQFALFLYERNVVMGSLSEGARVAAASERTVDDGERAAGKLLREALGGRIARTVRVWGAVESGVVVLRADAILPSFVPGLPGLEVHMTATMHKEEDLGVRGELRVAPGGGAAAPDASLTARGGDEVGG